MTKFLIAPLTGNTADDDSVIGAGTGIRIKVPTTWLDSYYDSAVFANKSAAIQAAYVAAAASRTVLECQAGRVYSLDTAALQLSPSTPITIEGHGATLQANWGTAACVSFQRTADGQTFEFIDIRDLTFDANVAANGNTSIHPVSVVGNDSQITSAQRVNFLSVYLRRCHWINVPTGTTSGTANYVCFAANSVQLAGDQPEAQNTIIDVRLEQCTAKGGNFGAIMLGQSSGGNAAVNVYLDKIYVDLEHDTLVTPTSPLGGANVQIGGFGYGDTCEVRVTGANSTDVGVEVDGMQTAHVYGYITDAWNSCYFGRNFHAPPHAASQRYILHQAEARCLNLQPDTAGPICAGFTAGSTATPVSQFGEMVLEDCTYRSSATQFRGNGSGLQIPQNALVGAVTITGTLNIVYDSVNDAPGSGVSPTPVFLLPGTAGNFVLGGGGNIWITYAGTASSNTTPRSVALSPQAGCTAIVDLGAITIASSLAGVSPGHTFGLMLGLSGAAGGSVRGRLRRLAWEAFSGGDTAPHLYTPQPSSQITVDGRFVIDEIDLRKDPAASPVFIQVSDATNQAKLPIRSANMPTYPIASVAMGTTNFVAGSFTTATGNQYIGSLPAEIHFATATGSGITAIDVSKDGATYENAYTQASGAMAQSVLVPVETGDFVKVTFATTQPTTRVRFRRAQ